MKNHAYQMSIVCDISQKFPNEKNLKIRHLVININQQDTVITTFPRNSLDLECLVT